MSSTANANNTLFASMGPTDQQPSQLVQASTTTWDNKFRAIYEWQEEDELIVMERTKPREPAQRPPSFTYEEFKARHAATVERFRPAYSGPIWDCINGVGQVPHPNNLKVVLSIPSTPASSACVEKENKRAGLHLLSRRNGKKPLNLCAEASGDAPRPPLPSQPVLSTQHRAAAPTAASISSSTLTVPQGIPFPPPGLPHPPRYAGLLPVPQQKDAAPPLAIQDQSGTAPNVGGAMLEDYTNGGSSGTTEGVWQQQQLGHGGASSHEALMDVDKTGVPIDWRSVSAMAVRSPVPPSTSTHPQSTVALESPETEVPGAWLTAWLQGSPSVCWLPAPPSTKTSQKPLPLPPTPRGPSDTYGSNMLMLAPCGPPAPPAPSHSNATMYERWGTLYPGSFPQATTSSSSAIPALWAPGKTIWGAPGAEPPDPDAGWHIPRGAHAWTNGATNKNEDWDAPVRGSTWPRSPQ